MRRRLLRAVGRMAGIGAGVDIASHPAGDDSPVLHQAILDVDTFGRPG